MKNPILIHNALDRTSIEFKDYLDSIGFKYCLLNWYSLPVSRDQKRNVDLTFRLINMHLTGALEAIPLAPPEPEVVFDDSDVESGSYPEEFDRWIRNCPCHKGEGYEGPPPRALPSLVYENEAGGFTLIDTPESLADITNPDPNKTWSCEKGEALAGQWVESAKACALSPYWSNHLIRVSVARFVKKYETISLKSRELELVENKQKVNNDRSLVL